MSAQTNDTVPTIHPTPVGIVQGTERRQVDLDQLHEVVVAIGSFVLYVVGTIGGALALGAVFGGWVGFLLLLAAGAFPSAYALRKTYERRLARENHERLKADREPVGGATAVSIPTLP